MILGYFLEYKGYIGSIEYSLKDQTYHGQLLNIKDHIGYHGDKLELLYENYLDAIDDYTEFKTKIRYRIKVICPKCGNVMTYKNWFSWVLHTPFHWFGKRRAKCTSCGEYSYMRGSRRYICED